MASAQPRQQVPYPTQSGNPWAVARVRRASACAWTAGDLAAAVMQVGCPVLGERQTIGMGQRLGQGQGLLTPLHGLRRIAQAPQRDGRIGQAPHPRRLAMAEHAGPAGPPGR